jgi:BMFP domain-containing protein YqiC
VDGGHPAELCFLTSAPHPRADNFKNTISLDQFVCEKLAPDTRFPSLTLSSGSSRGLSFSRSGVPIPAEERPSRLFRSMFVDGTPTEVKTQLQRLQQGRSIMDTVREEAAEFQKRLGQQDRRKLDEYFQAVREVEQRLNKSQAWAQRPKPKVDLKAPTDVANTQDIPARVRLMFDMLHLALQTDSTRYVTFALHGLNAVPVIAGVTQDWHNLSHHGQDPAKLAELRVIELEQMKLVGELLAKLKSTHEGSGTLLDNTIVMFGSNLGNASSHDNKNLPILVAGGGFRHGQHLAFDPAKPPPLCNLFVQFLHRLGVDEPRFGSSTSALSELAFT